MKITRGNTIKSTSRGSVHLDGATINGTATLRGRLYYNLKLVSGRTATVSHAEVMDMLRNESIEVQS